MHCDAPEFIKVIWCKFTNVTPMQTSRIILFISSKIFNMIEKKVNKMHGKRTLCLHIWKLLSAESYKIYIIYHWLLPNVGGWNAYYNVILPIDINIMITRLSQNVNSIWKWFGFETLHTCRWVLQQRTPSGVKTPCWIKRSLLADIGNMQLSLLHDTQCIWTL